MGLINEYILLGKSLGHSFSQKFFRDKFLREGIKADYINKEISSISYFTEVIKEINKNDRIKGMNVTIPYKEEIIPYLTSLDEEAAEIGAVNVIKIKKEGEIKQLIGYNTDIIGFTESLKPLLKETHKKALILGTGGASKAIAKGLKKLNIEYLFVSRSKRGDNITYKELKEYIKDYKIIINCSPIGTYPDIDEAPEIPYDLLTSEHILYDLVYNPPITQFLKLGKEQGVVIKNGREMLEIQAIESWNIWNK